jgi:hypothetical protein
MFQAESNATDIDSEDVGFPGIGICEATRQRVGSRPLWLDEDILAPQRKTLVQTICYRFVKALFLFDRSPFVERQLDEYAICGSLDTEISGIKNEAFGWMFCDYLETIILGDVQDSDHRFVDYLTDGSSVIG